MLEDMLAYELEKPPAAYGTYQAANGTPQSQVAVGTATAARSSRLAKLLVTPHAMLAASGLACTSAMRNGSGTVGTGCILELSRVHGSEAYPWLRPGEVFRLPLQLLAGGTQGIETTLERRRFPPLLGAEFAERLDTNDVAGGPSHLRPGGVVRRPRAIVQRVARNEAELRK